MRIRLALVCTTCLALVALPVMGASGDLDTDYGGDGTATVDSITSTVGVSSFKVAPDGRAALAVAGDPESGAGAIVAADGSGSVGLVLDGPGVVGFGPGTDVFAATAAEGNVSVSRFSTGGVVSHPLGLPDAFPSAILADSTGVVVAGGVLGEGSAWMAHLDADGRPDAEFGEGGIATIFSESDVDFVSAVEVSRVRDGYLVILLVRGQSDSVAALHVDARGTSRVVSSFPQERELFGVGTLRAADGSTVVVIQTTENDTDTFEVIRYDEMGARDANFDPPLLTDDEVAGRVHVTELRTGQVVVGYSRGFEHFRLRLLEPDGDVGGDLSLGPDVPDVYLHGLGVSYSDGGVLALVDETPISSGEPDDLSVMKLVGDDSGRFVDDDGSVHEDNIEVLAELGVTKGCDPPTNFHFCAGDPVSRGQMAAFFTRSFELTPATADYFVDDATSIFENDINRLREADITRGCNPPSNTAFCPTELVTRGQLAAFLVRAIGSPAGPDVFADDETSVFEDDINALAAAGITRGCDPPANTKFCPSEEVTRAQMASFLVRAISQTAP